MTRTTTALRVGLGLAVLVVAGALLVATITPTSATGPTTMATGPITSVRTIPITLPGAPLTEFPGSFACGGSNCVLTTSVSGRSTLWFSTNASLSFDKASLPRTGSLGEVACRDAATCYVIARSVTGSSARLLELADAVPRFVPAPVAPAYEPSTIGCLPNGPCWTTGTQNGTAAGYVRTNAASPWRPLPLPSIAGSTADSIFCATAHLCIDLTSTKYAMASASGAFAGSLSGGFSRTLATPNVANLESTACDLSACWFTADPLPTHGGIRLTELTPTGTRTVAVPAASDAVLHQLDCSATSCLALVEERGRTVTRFFLLGAHPVELRTPKGFAADPESLVCDLGPAECIAALSTADPGTSLLVHVAPFRGSLAIGTTLTLEPGGSYDPNPAALTSCTTTRCFEVRQLGTHLALVAFTPLQTRPTGVYPITDPAAGYAFLWPIALSCPNARACDLVARLGDTSDVLIDVSLGSDHPSVHAVPTNAEAEDLACATPTHCVIGVAGISHHHGFPVLVTTDGGRHFAPATVTNAANDLSVLDVSCPTQHSCVAIAQHDFALGDGSLRPAIATSADGGRRWQLVRIIGSEPVALLDEATTSLACTDGGCVGMLTAQRLGDLAGNTTLLFTGGPSGTSFEVHTLPVPSSHLSVPITSTLACADAGCLATVSFTQPPKPTDTVALTLTQAGEPGIIRRVPPPAPAGLGATVDAFLGTESSHDEWIVPTRG